MEWCRLFEFVLAVELMIMKGLDPTKNFIPWLSRSIDRTKVWREGVCWETFYTQLVPVTVMGLNFPDSIHRVPVLCFVSPYTSQIHTKRH